MMIFVSLNFIPIKKKKPRCIIWNPTNLVSNLASAQLSYAIREALLTAVTQFLHPAKCQLHGVAVKIKCSRRSEELCVLPDT